MESKLTFLSWNVNGMNSPQKRKKVFYWLNKQNLNVTCLQEVHIKQIDEKFLKYKRLGMEFTSLAKVKKRGVVIYVKESLQPRKIFEDQDGRYVAVEIMLEGKKTLILGIYAPNGPKELFFKNLKKKMDQEIYDQVIMMGHFNGVIYTGIDKLPKKKGGKLPKIFGDLTSQEDLVDSGEIGIQGVKILLIIPLAKRLFPDWI